MADPFMIPGLSHEFTWSGKPEGFFEAIDSAGGWRLGFKYVGFEHTDSRAAGFTNSPHNSGWWTVICSSDDYFLWKLSPAALQRVADAVLAAVTTPHVDVTKVWIRDSRGHRAAIGRRAS